MFGLFAAVSGIGLSLLPQGYPFGSRSIIEPGSERYVVVYYANETTTETLESEPYQKLQNILALSGHPLAHKLAASVAQDARLFPASVRFKTSEFIAQARRRSFDLAIFTNELALEHQYLFFNAAAQELERAVFPAKSSTAHPFLKAAPLSQAEAIEQALNTVVRRYSDASLRILLIVQSHGTHEMALMPRVSTDVDQVTPAELILALDEDAGTPLPNWARLQGTTKAEFWRTLGRQGSAHPNITFPLVILASCESGLGGWEEYWAIPSTVGLIAHTGMRQLSTRSEPLDLVLGNADGSLSLSDVLPAVRQAGFDVDTKVSLTAWLVPLALWQLPLFLYFLPLAALLIYLSVRKLIQQIKVPSILLR